jgi:hypothetical protein
MALGALNMDPETLKPRSRGLWGHLLQGWVVWVLALGAAWTLPGRAILGREGRDVGASALPLGLGIVAPSLVSMVALALVAPLLAWAMGSRLARHRGLALWEAPPGFFWAGLLLAIWPASAGPPGRLALVLVFLIAALPSELRWLCQAMPREEPFPAVWGRRAVRCCRSRTLRRLAPRWLAVRLPLWLTATVVLERILAVPALGSDWMARLAARDRIGLACWILAFALLWTLMARAEGLSSQEGP